MRPAPLRLILVITVIVIVYGSLYPFAFHSAPVHGSLWTTLNTWPARLDRFEIRDIAINAFIYLPIGFFGSLWLKTAKGSRWGEILPVAFALLLSVSIEIVQYFDDSRSPGFSDVVSNGVGAVLGVLLARIYCGVGGPLTCRFRIRESPDSSAAMLLLFAQVGYQTFPFFPQMSTSVLRVKLAALIHPGPVAILPAIGAMIDWLAVAQLLEAVVGPENVGLLLPVAWALIPARLFILGRTFNWADIIGATAAWCLWSGWLHRSGRRTVVIAWLASGMLLVRGLAPYHWRLPATPFCWIPFAPLLTSDWSSSALVFFSKSFLYGTAVWLFARAGYRYTAAVIGLAIELAAIEAVQIFLPGRSPEISDPLMLLILATILKVLGSIIRKPEAIPTVARSG